MNDKQLLQMLEVLGKNSRRSMSLAASDLADRDQDTRCATTLRKIITGHNDFVTGTNKKSLAASAPAANPNVNRVKVLTQFIFRNGLR